MNYYDHKLRESRLVFPMKDIKLPGGDHLYLCTMSYIAHWCDDLNELEDTRRYRWYYCGGTGMYWRFDYKEKVFDAGILTEHVSKYLLRRKGVIL